MKYPAPQPDDLDDADPKLRIYFLPNLMTAGNLFCGFVALTKIVEADLQSANFDRVIKTALAFIFLACVFDLLDGRMARWGGHESPFGREFDSLADLISFGAAPAFLVHRIVLKDVFHSMPELGWFIASIYLICGALRLARFNTLALHSGRAGGREFLGFPIPAAAGMVASLTLFLLWLEERNFPQGRWRYVLPVMMIFLSVMMVSSVKYPSFKSIDLRSRSTFTKTVIAGVFIGSLVVLREKIFYFVLPLVFTAYLVYGFVRPRISIRMRREIEDAYEDEEDGEEPDGGLRSGERL
jgi:CDP-diacylglycerol--serine O-phosphatidyltransferase